MWAKYGGRAFNEIIMLFLHFKDLFLKSGFIFYPHFSWFSNISVCCKLGFSACRFLTFIPEKRWEQLPLRGMTHSGDKRLFIGDRGTRAAPLTPKDQSGVCSYQCCFWCLSSNHTAWLWLRQRSQPLESWLVVGREPRFHLKKSYLRRSDNQNSTCLFLHSCATSPTLFFNLATVWSSRRKMKVLRKSDVVLLPELKGWFLSVVTSAFILRGFRNSKEGGKVLALALPFPWGPF